MSSNSVVDVQVFCGDTVAMETLAKRIRGSREQAGLTMEELGRRVGVTRSAVSQWETGATEPTPENLRATSEAIDVDYSWLATGKPYQPRYDIGEPHLDDKANKVMIVGEVAAGRWIQFNGPDPVDFEHVESPFPPDPAYPVSAQFDLRVSGTSLNRFARNGQYLRCLNLMAVEIEVRDNDIVIFERIRDGGALREITAKRVRQRGKFTELWPDSDDPQWQQPYRLPFGEHESEEGRITAVVLYVFSPARS